MTHDEIERLQVGDVFLYGPRRTPRIIRKLNGPPSKSQTGYKVYTVQVAIRNCSWTGAADTYIYRHTLRTKCETTGIRVKLDSAEDYLFDLELIQRRSKHGGRVMGCCLAKKLPA